MQTIFMSSIYPLISKQALKLRGFYPVDMSVYHLLKPALSSRALPLLQDSMRYSLVDYLECIPLL